MSHKAEVLLVEDEESIRNGLVDVLLYHGYAVTPVASGEEGLERALAGGFAVVVLDVMLPGLNGFDVCARVREERPHQPILLLTAKGSEDDIVEGFRRGADDYVTKPFSIRELLARIEALSRRGGEHAPNSRPVSFGDWTVDPARLLARPKEASDGDDGAVSLTPRELKLLLLLTRERGRVVSRRLLLKEVWDLARADEIETRTVDMHIAKLRKKIDPTSQLIQTVRGAGYRYEG